MAGTCSVMTRDVEYQCFVGELAWVTNNNALKKVLSLYNDIVESKVRLLQALHLI
ncbi:Glycine-rich RNA-binding protein [Spatholobus suberectus]|nr:Glycine-rich RNA-binding protein [Spatholobus suberectus]